MSRIAPTIAPRLWFHVLDASGEPVAGLVAADITSAAYVTVAAGIRSAQTAISLGADVAETAAHLTGQVVTIDSADGWYAIDAPAGAASSAADYAQLVIVLVDGTQAAYPTRHKIDASVSSRSTATDITDARDVITDRLPATLIGGRMDCRIGAIATDAITADAIQAGAITSTAIAANALTAAKFAAGAFDAVWTVTSRSLTEGVDLTVSEHNSLVADIEVEILNDGTGGAVIQTIADAVAGYFDSASLDLPPQIIAAAVRTELSPELGRIDTTVSSRASQSSVDAVDDYIDTEIATLISRVDVNLSTRSSHSANDVKTFIEANGSKLDTLFDDWTDGGRLDQLLDAVSTHDPDAVVTAMNAVAGNFKATGFATTADVAAALVTHFETQTRVKGNISILKLLELLLAGMIGKSSAPDSTTEKYKYLDDTDAVTVTFDANNYRTAVSLT